MFGIRGKMAEHSSKLGLSWTNVTLVCIFMLKDRLNHYYETVVLSLALKIYLL